MADEDGDDLATGGGTADPAALHVALDPANAASQEARDYLKKQARLADLQIENLEKLDEFEVSHLRWRRFNDQMRGALQIMVVGIGALIVIAIGAAMWNASKANGLVVESFSVPPAFAQAGMGSDVVADDLTNKLDAVRDIADGNSLDVSQNVRKEGAEDVKVEIPDTGVSLAQAYRYLRAWLGHERRVTGSLRETPDGRITLTVAMEGQNAFALSGNHDDLDKLEQQAAERLFADIDPLNYVLYLQGMRRLPESLSAALRATQLIGTPVDRADAYALLSGQTRVVTGDMYLAMARARVGIAIYPRIATGHRELMRAAQMLGHEEEALKWARLLPALHREDQPPTQQGPGYDQLMDEAEQERVTATGDFSVGIAQGCKACTWADREIARAEYEARSHDVLAARADLATALASDERAAFRTGSRRYFVDAASNNWAVAAADARSDERDLFVDKNLTAAYARVGSLSSPRPLYALALAEQGDFRASHAQIDTTPADCTLCQTVRGEIDALEKNDGGAAFWFAHAIQGAPSIPYAYTDWGAMLLREGKPDAAVAKFAGANKVGPHFADPLELWGEALMLKNQSGLALAKFAEANQYAPNWGRLHLKWGEALRYAGQPDEANRQFAVAAGLFLTAADRAALAKDQHG